jgi:heme exporter protein A
VSADFDRVVVDDVSRHYGRRRAVSHLSLTAGSGHIVGLLGPNGAGKSTLIAMLATLVKPTSGAILYGEHLSGGSVGEVRGRIGLLAHELFLYPELTARQNLEFFARVYGVRPSDVVPQALDGAQLRDRADEPIATFSRGMRQRVALERALLHRPRLLLLDEPFTGLDDHSAALVGDRLRALAADGAIVLLATHDLDLVDGLVTQAVIMRDGRVVVDEAAGPGLRARYRAVMSAH